MHKKKGYEFEPVHLLYGLPVVAAVGAGAFIALRWQVCAPHEYLVRTGFGIKNMSVTRHGVVWPFQVGAKISLQPSSFSFNLRCLSKQYLPFEMPVTYTVRPKNPEDDLAGFKLYAENMEHLTLDEFRNTLLGGCFRGSMSFFLFPVLSVFCSFFPCHPLQV